MWLQPAKPATISTLWVTKIESSADTLTFTLCTVSLSEKEEKRKLRINFLLGGRAAVVSGILHGICIRCCSLTHTNTHTHLHLLPLFNMYNSQLVPSQVCQAEFQPSTCVHPSMFPDLVRSADTSNKFHPRPVWAVLLCIRGRWWRSVCASVTHPLSVHSSTAAPYYWDPAGITCARLAGAELQILQMQTQIQTQRQRLLIQMK